MQYQNIRISIDWNARSVSMMSPNVRMLDSSFDKYIFCKKAYWNTPGLMEIYDNIPVPQKGKIMTPSNRGTDFLEKSGCFVGLSGLVAIVSQRFIDVMNAAGVSSDEYITKSIEIINSKETYFLFFVPFYNLDSFDIEQTFFFNKQNNVCQTRQFSSWEEWLNDKNFFRIQRLTVKKAEYSKDLIHCRGVMGLFVSDRVKKALQDAGIRGFDIHDEYQLKVLAYGDSRCQRSDSYENGESIQIAHEQEILQNQYTHLPDESEDNHFDTCLSELFIEYFNKIPALRRHAVLASWNFDNPKDILKNVVSQSETDIATAQMIYWRLEPESVRDYEDEDDMSILETIEQNISRSFYKDNGIAYNPRDDGGYDVIHDNTEHTPETMYHPELLKVREGIHVDGITSNDGIPEELYPEYVRLVRSFGLEDVYL